MSENVSQPDEDPNVCIWKPPIKQKISGKVQLLKFPCRYPDKPKITENCTPCLLGDVFAMNYTQMQNMKSIDTSMKKQSGLNDEIMTYLRDITSDGSLDDLK